MSERRVPTKDYARQYREIWSELAPALERAFFEEAPVLGRPVAAFEEAFARFVGVRFAVGVNSGTDALVLALRALGVGPGDEVVTCAHTFVATVSAIAAVGARPVLVDAEERSMLLDPARVEQAVGPRTKALVPVHLYGRACDMAALGQIAERHGLVVLEDAAQAHGARAAGGRRVGSLGRAAAFSFHPSKNLGAFGDAGAVTTDDERIAEQVRVLRNLGKVDKWRVRSLAPNSKLDTIQAVVLGVKLSRLEAANSRRRAIARRYDEALRGVGDLVLPDPGDGEPVYHLYVVRTARRDALREFLAQRGIRTGVHYPVPPHLQPLDVDLGYRPGDFPVAERIASEVVSLPVAPELTDEEIDRVIEGIREFFGS